ncbi:MAG: hypothetical protein P8J20_14840 [Novosphingobium sp.]|nr:hypothetical protein [Novosphingobium sp.]
MSAATTLPPGFEALEGFAERWALDGTANRAQARNDSSAAEREAFYEAASPMLAPALELLDSKALDDLDDADTRLMNMMLGLTHVALAIETQRDAESIHVVSRRTMMITQSSADWPA